MSARFSPYLLLGTCLFISHTVLAAWNLDNKQSSLDFTSTKNKDIQETSQFTELSGQMNDNGHAKLLVKLNSVNTRIPLRDERMREILFETLAFPQAIFEVNVDPKKLAALSDGQEHTLTIDGTLDLHGMKHAIETDIIAQEMPNGSLLIRNAQPIVLNVEDYNMEAGLEELRGLASLVSISSNVPVNFTLTFVKAS